MFCSPNIDEPQVSAVTAGFGDALATALDMMAFAHDLDLSTATDGIPSNADPKQSNPKPLNIDQTKSALYQEAKVTCQVQPQEKPAEVVDKQENVQSDLTQNTEEHVDVHEPNLKNDSKYSEASY